MTTITKEIKDIFDFFTNFKEEDFQVTDDKTLNLKPLEYFLTLPSEFKDKVKNKRHAISVLTPNGFYSYKKGLNIEFDIDDYRIWMGWSIETNKLVNFGCIKKDDFYATVDFNYETSKLSRFYISKKFNKQTKHIEYGLKNVSTSGYIISGGNIAKQGGFEINHNVTHFFKEFELLNETSVVFKGIENDPKVSMDCGCSWYPYSTLKSAFSNRWTPIRKHIREPHRYTKRGALFHALGLYQYPEIKVKKKYNRKIYKSTYLTLFHTPGNITFEDKQMCRKVITHLKKVHKV